MSNANLSGGSSLSTPVAVDEGGTGQSSYTNGQLLIGNTTGNTLDKATLTAGTGIGIANGSGSITISSTVSGGSLALLDSGTPSAVASISFDNTLITDTYDHYLLVVDGLTPATDDVLLYFRVSNDNGSSFHSSGYVSTCGLSGSYAAATAGIHFSGTGAGFRWGTGTGENGSLVIQISSPTDASLRTRIIGHGSLKSSGAANYYVTTSGWYDTAEDNDALQLVFSSGNVASAKYELYGLSKT